ncbi:unnamed protein product, partial [Amoebophrya sp. A25]|eukprot:GSA25T00021931001.1
MKGKAGKILLVESTGAGASHQVQRRAPARHPSTLSCCGWTERCHMANASLSQRSASSSSSSSSSTKGAEEDAGKQSSSRTSTSSTSSGVMRGVAAFGTVVMALAVSRDLLASQLSTNNSDGGRSSAVGGKDATSKQSRIQLRIKNYDPASARPPPQAHNVRLRGDATSSTSTKSTSSSSISTARWQELLQWRKEALQQAGATAQESTRKKLESTLREIW